MEFRSLVSRVLSIDTSEASFERRRFRLGSDECREHLERIGHAFILGYNLALSTASQERLLEALELEAPEYRGFAHEGAGMALAILDSILPFSGKRWDAFHEQTKAEYTYLLHVGYGWAVARIPWLRWRLRRTLLKFDGLLKWLVIDGLGFHDGYFDWDIARLKRSSESTSLPYFVKAYHQGLGRCAWFVSCGEPETILRNIESFSIDFRGDMWSGLGLACGYAGGVSPAEIKKIVEFSAGFRSNLAQGVAFGVSARLLSQTSNERTDMASEIVCGLDAVDVAALTNAVVAGESRWQLSYEDWREKVRSLLCTQENARSKTC